jgi:hypothetical protein
MRERVSLPINHLPGDAGIFDIRVPESEAAAMLFLFLFREMVQLGSFQ